MANNSDPIDRIFQYHENSRTGNLGTQSQENTPSKEASGSFRKVSARFPAVESEKDEIWEEDTENDENEPYRPIQRNREYRTGCLGGLMFAVFIACISIVLACLAWMAASDMLALNKEEYTATIVIPTTIFETENVEETDESGKVTGTKTISHADIDYVSNTLKQAGLIEYKWLFELFCKVSHADQKIKPGEYELQSTFDYRALVSNMRPNSGSALTVDITFIEGMTMDQMFRLMERKGVSEYNDLVKAAKEYTFNYGFLLEPGEEGAERLEGYLFPDTYQFYINMQASSAINRFLSTFDLNMTDEMMEKVEASGYTLREIITIASYIEKEAANDAERAEIASVIYNRLNSNMSLGIDASILYVHQDHEGAPTADMLAEESPYNTRLYTGLTPTPICNPGLASIQAALAPASTDYTYYALDTATGTHRFFTNINDFNAFVASQNYD